MAQQKPASEGGRGRSADIPVRSLRRMPARWGGFAGLFRQIRTLPRQESAGTLRLPSRTHYSRQRLFRAGFTLAEVLVAMAFMAIVIPVAVRGLQIANRAGVVAQRKAIAARVGERVINEIVVARQYSSGTQSGTEMAGPYQFRWTLHNQPWNQISANQTTASTTGINTSIVNANNIHELSVDVVFSVQSQDYTVHLSTLVDTTQAAMGTTNPLL